MLMALTFAAGVGTALQADLALSETDEFGKAEPSLKREQQGLQTFTEHGLMAAVR
jgi:hypothetical protein